MSKNKVIKKTKKKNGIERKFYVHTRMTRIYILFSDIFLV